MWTAETCQFGDSGEANNLRLCSLMFAYVRLMGEKLLGALRAATMRDGERREATAGTANAGIGEGPGRVGTPSIHPPIVT